ncbi:MAG: universal stress protein [Alphaproteobacteria bacterium]|nr:universal stress protein [Alphaproteobacteria bacterium]
MNDRDNRRVLDVAVLLGVTGASRMAREFALDIAAGEKGRALGVTGIDLAFIDKPEPVPPGAMDFRVRGQATLRHQAVAIKRQVTTEFADACRQRGVEHEIVAFDGEPGPALVKAAAVTDFLVTGCDTGFRGAIQESPSECVEDYLREMPRPALITPESKAEGRDVLIAYDASLPAMRTIQNFVFSGLFDDRRVLTVAVCETRAEADGRLDELGRYLARHGRVVEPHPIVTSVSAGEALRLVASDRKPALMVLGAFGHRGIKEVFLGSTTTDLVAAPPCPLFLYR